MVDPGLLVEAASKLKKLDLYSTNLTQQQLYAILTALRQGHQISELNIGGNNLSGIDPVLLDSPKIVLVDN